MGGQLGDLTPRNSIALGVIVGLISTSIQSIGLTLQRKSHILEDVKGSHIVKRPPYRRRRWQLGMSMFIVSNILGSTIQITTLPLPVLSTLQASGLVFNTLCATLILGEPFTRWSFGGTVLVCAGAILIATFGAMKEPAHSLDELLQLLARRPFIVWMIGQAVLAAAVLSVAKLLKVVNPKTKHTPRKRLMRGIAYGCISGFLSGHSLLLAKSSVELLMRSIFDKINQFNHWQSWMILLGLVTFALTQLYYLHRGLKLCSTSVLYPLVFCVYNITAILDGLIYFRQTSKLSALHAVLITLGTIILLSGVLALSWRLDHHQEPPPKSTTPNISQNPLSSSGLGFLNEDGHRENDNPDDDEEEHRITRPKQLYTSYSYFSQYSTLVEQQQRDQQQEEAAEIWNELEDDDEHEIEEYNDDDNDNDGGDPNESTALLQRKRRMRRRSSGFIGGLPGRRTRRRRRSSLAAAAAAAHPHPDTELSFNRSSDGIGGIWEWWKIRWWWWRKDGKRDEG